MTASVLKQRLSTNFSLFFTVQLLSVVLYLDKGDYPGNFQIADLQIVFVLINSVLLKLSCVRFKNKNKINKSLKSKIFVTLL